MTTTTSDSDSMFTIPQHTSVDVCLPVSLDLDVGSSVSAVGQFVSEYMDGIIDLYFNELQNLPFNASDLNELLKFERSEDGTDGVAQTIFVNIGAADSVGTGAFSAVGDGFSGSWNGLKSALELLCKNHHSHHMVLDTVKSENGLMHCHDNRASFNNGAASTKTSSSGWNGALQHIIPAYHNEIITGDYRVNAVSMTDGMMQAVHNFDIGNNFCTSLLATPAEAANYAQYGTNHRVYKTLVDALYDSYKGKARSHQDFQYVNTLVLSGPTDDSNEAGSSYSRQMQGRLNDIANLEEEYMNVNNPRFRPGDTIKFKLDISSGIQVDTDAAYTQHSDSSSMLNIGSLVVNDDYLSNDHGDSTDTDAKLALYNAVNRVCELHIRLNESSDECQLHINEIDTIIGKLVQEQSGSSNSISELLKLAIQDKNNIDSEITGNYSTLDEQIDQIEVLDSATGNVVNANVSNATYESLMDQKSHTEDSITFLQHAAAAISFKITYWNSQKQFWETERQTAVHRETDILNYGNITI